MQSGKLITFSCLILLAFPSITYSQTNYCEPTVNIQNSGGHGFSLVKIVGPGDSIIRTSGTSEGYVNPTDTITVEAGDSLEVSTTVNIGPFCSQQNHAVYIDLNYDKDFTDNNEDPLSWTNRSQTSHSGFIVIPSNTLAGTGRIRVMTKMTVDCGHSVLDPCGTDPFQYHGEVEDFFFTVEEPLVNRAKGEANNLQNLRVLQDHDSESFDVIFSARSGFQGNLEIFSLQGQKILSKKTETINGGTIKIPIKRSANSLSQSGIYIVRLSGTKTETSKKFVLF